MGSDGESGKRGRAAGWLLNALPAVLVTFLVLVVVVVVRVRVTSSTGAAEARDALRESARQTRYALSRVAAEGAPPGTRIERALRVRETELAQIRRDGRRTLVTARLSGLGSGVIGPSRETGCYEFRVAQGRPASVTFKKLELYGCYCFVASLRAVSASAAPPLS